MQDECFCSKLGMDVEYVCEVQSKHITFSDFGDLSLASFCQSRAEYSSLLENLSVDDNDKVLHSLTKLVILSSGPLSSAITIIADFIYNISLSITFSTAHLLLLLLLSPFASPLLPSSPWFMTPPPHSPPSFVYWIPDSKVRYAN